ncbi:MAG: hypothetical protein ACREBG_21430, partial [Pyrinomonadaceae bacterium]
VPAGGQQRQQRLPVLGGHPPGAPHHMSESLEDRVTRLEKSTGKLRSYVPDLEGFMQDLYTRVVPDGDALSTAVSVLDSRVSANSANVGAGSATSNEVSVAIAVETSNRVSADNALSNAISVVSQQISVLSQQVSILSQSVSALSQQASVHSQQISVLSQAISVISQQVSVLSQRVSTLENRVSANSATGGGTTILTYML